MLKFLIFACVSLSFGKLVKSFKIYRSYITQFVFRKDNVLTDIEVG